MLGEFYEVATSPPSAVIALMPYRKYNSIKQKNRDADSLTLFDAAMMGFVSVEKGPTERESSPSCGAYVMLTHRGLLLSISNEWRCAVRFR